jgi:hypothetical protein
VIGIQWLVSTPGTNLIKHFSLSLMIGTNNPDTFKPILIFVSKAVPTTVEHLTLLHSRVEIFFGKVERDDIARSVSDDNKSFYNVVSS